MHDKTILIADNSIINRMQMGGILASEYNILEADNGHDALDIMRERGEDGIDAVLLDLHMPGQTGFGGCARDPGEEFSRRIRCRTPKALLSKCWITSTQGILRATRKRVLA